MDLMRTARVYAGVDVSKDRLDVCLRWSEPESHERMSSSSPMTTPPGSTPWSLRLLEEPPVLVILEATGGFERAVVVGAFFGRRGLAGSGAQPSPGA